MRYMLLFAFLLPSSALATTYRWTYSSASSSGMSLFRYSPQQGVSFPGDGTMAYDDRTEQVEVHFVSGPGVPGGAVGYDDPFPPLPSDTFTADLAGHVDSTAFDPVLGVIAAPFEEFTIDQFTLTWGNGTVWPIRWGYFNCFGLEGYLSGIEPPLHGQSGDVEIFLGNGSFEGPVAVPEPSSVLLCQLGLYALRLGRRKRESTLKGRKAPSAV